MTIKVIFKLLILLTISFGFSTISFSQSDSPQIDNEVVNKLAQELVEETMSPFCPGRTLQACPSEDARQLKIQITSLLSLGYSKDAVRRKLLTMYGEKISGLPANNSFKNIAWISPAVFGLIGLIIVYFGLRFMKNNRDRIDLSQEQSKAQLLEIEKKLRR